MQCLRCGGLMIVETFYDLQDDMGRVYFDAFRCLNCGEIVDPMILMNRRMFGSSLVH